MREDMALSELDNYLQRLEDLRGQVRDLISDLDSDALNWRPIEGPAEGDTGHATNSLAILATHIAGAEHFWIGEVLGGHPRTRDRDAEFVTEAAGAAELVHRLEEAGAETRAVLATLDESSLNGTREVPERGMVPVRWCILHVIDHTSLHLGHMQLTYQLWAGGKSKPSPFWFERLRSGD